MNTNEYLLTSILDCGVLDLNVLNKVVDELEELVPTNIDYFHDAMEQIQANGEQFNFNSLMFELTSILLDTVIDKLNSDTGILLDWDDFDHYINYMDSSITYLGDNDKVKKWLENNCKFIQY